MICCNCGYKLPYNGVEKCNLCGMKFPLKCTVCNYPNPQYAKFCFNCGSKLLNDASESSVQNFEVLEENRKNVAVIFADVSGFTSLSEKMDPEEVRELINSCFEYITKPVYELEGTIDKYIGDCVMILFGAKYSHSDDGKRAVKCAIKMLELIDEFSNIRFNNKEISLSLSIGINYGLVVTGSIGNYFDKDYTVMGDVVNTAQRLQSSAGRGNILVSEAVYTETNDVIHYSDPKNIVVKHKENPVKCYSPISLIERDDYSNILLLDREFEITYLNTIYKDIEHCHYVNIIGESGIGRSTLAKKFVSNLNSDIKGSYIDCISMYQNRAYFTISKIILNIINVDFEDSNRIKRNRLKSYIDYLLKNNGEEEILRNYNFISLVLGLDRDDDFQLVLNSMNYSDIEREIVIQIIGFFTALSKRMTFVLIIDNIEWSDIQSLTILDELLEPMTATKSMFIFISQFEVEGLGFIKHKASNKINLKKLSKSCIEILIKNILKCNNVDKVFFDKVMEVTNGNPSYINEFISEIKRKGQFYIDNETAYLSSAEELIVSESIEKIILSKLSEFNNTTLKFLQIASVFGKEFNLTLISSLLDKNIDLLEILTMPVHLNIIALKSVVTSQIKQNYSIAEKEAEVSTIDKIYVFCQDAVREVVYNSILNKNKKLYHKKIAELIEKIYADDIENYYEVLCIHYNEAGIYNKAQNYYYKTAGKYKNDFLFISALEYYYKFIEITKKANSFENNSKVLAALIDVADIYTTLGDYDNALAALNNALNIARLSDDIYLITIMICNISKEMGKYEQALSKIQEIEPKMRPNSLLFGKLLKLKIGILSILGNSSALKIAEESEGILLKNKDYLSLSEIMSQAGILYFINGDLENAMFYLISAYNYAEKINDLSMMVKASGNLGIIYHASGMISKAFEFFNKTMEIANKISNRQDYIVASINLGILYIDKGLFSKAKAILKDAVQSTKKLSMVYQTCVALTNIGDLEYEAGNYESAYGYYNESLKIALECQLPVEEAINCLGLFKIYLKDNSIVKEQNINAMAEKAYTAFNEASEISYISDYYKYRGIEALINKEYDYALICSNQSISKAEEAKSDIKKLNALRLKGNVLCDMHKFSEAWNNYDEAIKLSEQLESDYEMAKCYYRMYILEMKRNKVGNARKYLLKAKEEIDKVDKCNWTDIIYKAFPKNN